MVFDRLQTYDAELTDTIVDLHIQSLGYRSFITQFGPRFLRNIYKIILSSKIGFICYAKEEKKLLGFICVIFASRQLFPALVKRLPILLPSMLKGILDDLSLLKKTFGSVSYGKNTQAEIPCELLVIAVNPDFRSQKIGERLLQSAEDFLAQKKIRRYKVTVHQEMAASRRFYEKNGFSLADTFKMNDITWCEYVKAIDGAATCNPET